MHYCFPVAAIWLAFLFSVLSYFTRSGPWGKKFRRAGLAALAAAVILFLLWAAFRAAALFPR